MKYVYKIISAVSSLAVLPAIVFSPMIYYYISSVALQGIFTLAQLAGSDALANAMKEHGWENVPEGISGTLSIYDIGELVAQFGGNSDSGEIPEAVEMMIPLLLAAAIAIVFVIVCAIVTAVLAFACKDNRKVIASSIAGVGFSLMVPMLIENALYPITSGTISLSSLLNTFWAPLVAEIEELSVAPLYYLIPALFGFVALWTILYNATLPEKEKAERLKMIG
ncbi:MAG: hypothetical protein E7522_08220 [Ruminococcaceae bacterium]|nr:hypothetical protein [Oscillospiraceae bacterium]